jgi:predicted nucleotidyltransferase
MYSSWPALPERYDRALRLAVSDVETQYHPVGIIAAGSILRGQGGPTSDIDFYVVHLEPFRQRLQRLYHDTPFEVFINPPHQVRRYFEAEHRDARPITAHMLTTGLVLLDQDPVVQTLRNEAAQWLATPPNLTPDALRLRRYLIGDLLDNARDVVDGDPDTARLFLHRALQATIDYRFLVENLNLPRPKDALHELRRLDAACAALVHRALTAQAAPDQLEIVVALAARAAAVTGYFEWDSTPDPVHD